MSGRGRGRGEYFKNKYGGGRGGRGRGGGTGQPYPPPPQSFANANQASATGEPRNFQQLQYKLWQINNAQYGAYKQLLGRWSHTTPDFTLAVDHVQGDAYAAPSKVRAIMPWSQTSLPDEYLQSDIRRIALCDFVTRIAANFIRTKHMNESLGGGGGWSGPKGGSFNINAPGQEVLPRTSTMITGRDMIELRFTTSLPAAGRSVLAKEAWEILGVNLVELVKMSLLYANVDQKKLHQHVLSAERQSALRDQLQSRNLITFVANGAILPRASGGVAAPMEASKAVLFKSPPEAEVKLKCPDGSNITGMGITRGVTLLTGGGFHGKSTLLEAIELGIYNHFSGDGRELIVTDPTAVKIRAEDGRSVSSVDISPFIADLPGGKNTTAFSTDDASGSTSMATNIQEALEVGSKTLLIDEDSSATNLLVRDARMQALIKKEPITPLIAKARAAFADHGVSTLIVIGGLGDWLAVADNVVAMDAYVPHIITAAAKEVVAQFPSAVTQDAKYGSLPQRSFRVDLSQFRTPFAQRKRFISLKPQERNPVDDPSEGESGIDLAGLDQIVEIGQTRTVAALLTNIAAETKAESVSLGALLQHLDKAIGLDKCMPVSFGDGEMVAVRRFELAEALSRMRGVVVAS